MMNFEPETERQLRERFERSCDTVYDYRQGFPAVAPSSRREHVFDYADGLRMIVSLDREDDGAPYLHVSASAVPNSELYRHISYGMVRRPQFKQIVEARFEVLSGKPFDLEFCGFSATKAVPHWRRRERVQPSCAGRGDSNESLGARNLT